MNNRRPIGEETLPVTAESGETLGTCTLQKFPRQPGEPRKAFLIDDTAGRRVATVWVYRLHSLIHCGGAEEVHIPCRIESKHGVQIAREALAWKARPGALMEKVKQEAERLQSTR
jgi:hypothetical protein